MALVTKAKRIETDQTPTVLDLEATGTTIDNVVDLPIRTVTERTDTVVAFVKENPVLALAGGVALGVLAATLFPRRPRPRLGKRGAKLGDAVIVVPTVDDKLVTPHTEAFQAVVWHCLVSHPKLQVQATKW